ncbi:MAG: alpha/beta fold hydrolase [Rubinisphaera brasiliensis]|uniref:alpha/beta fold hydrolase n=1 Tax=Rubinisphaera brasiliensis TaxID=119 RepID=UPI00391C1F17
MILIVLSLPQRIAMKHTPETTFVDIAGRKTQITRGGQGTPLLYLHSAGGETEWTRYHDLLADHFEVFLPAHPGFDNSEGLETVNCVTDYAWHYVDLMDHFGWDSVPVVGFSLGGWTGMELSVLRPQRVSKLVLVNAAGIHLPEKPMAELFGDDLDELRERLYFDPESPAVEESMPTTRNDPRLFQWLKAREATAKVGWNPYLHNPELPSHLRRIECPVRILWGRHDRLIPVETGHFLAKGIPNATLEIFEEAGHMLPFEHSDRLCREIVQFVQGE